MLPAGVMPMGPLSSNTPAERKPNQEWQFQPTDSGYYEIVNRNALSAAARICLGCDRRTLGNC